MKDELDSLKKKAERRNIADRMLAAKYSGDVKYMRTHKKDYGKSATDCRCDYCT